MTIAIHRRCPVCGVNYSFVVPYAEWVAYCEGNGLIQDAMPTTPPAIREQIMTGIHAGKCWEEATKVDDTDCISCAEGLPRNECKKSERECGHHCNHGWTHEQCDWCGTVFDG